MRISRLALTAGPLCFLGYGVIRFVGRMDGHYGPGMDWFTAHVVGLLGFVMFGALVLGIRRLLPAGPWREVASVTALVSLATLLVQFTADIVAGLVATDRAEMSAALQPFQSFPGVRATFYLVGPQLWVVALLALTVMLARAGRLRWWSVALFALGSALPLITLDLAPLAALCYLVAFAPLASPPTVERERERPSPRHA
ncbi:hypothetical protein [Streptoalloteichus hindustanus]|uniref:hypothetical protein n=1 Tax=Streptoalloteichus hindustanus TaxID=2017 RepID=UPI0009363560|nr:hypothetical protein [Streptoalloteichus hindustanus]